MVSNYGVKKYKFKTFLPLVETLAGSSTPAIRAEAMNFYKELYKFIGEAVKDLNKGLKKQQLVRTNILMQIIFGSYMTILSDD